MWFCLLAQEPTIEYGSQAREFEQQRLQRNQKGQQQGQQQQQQGTAAAGGGGGQSTVYKGRAGTRPRSTRP